MPPPHVPPHCFQTPCGNRYIDIDRERAPPPPTTLFSREREMMGLQIYKKVTDPFTESVRAKIIAHSPSHGTHKPPSSFTFPQEQEQEELHTCACGHSRCNCALNCTNNYEEEEEEGEASSTHAWNLYETTQSVGSLCIPEDPTLLRHVRMALEAVLCHKVGEEPFSVHLHIVRHLRALGYNAALCKSHWAYNSSTSLAAGSYEYIDVVMAAGKERVIVDVNFRSEFQIARAEEQYRVLLEALPLVFVGRLQNLKQVVKLMCQAAEQSLRRQGLEVPPWRKCQYMQHKWQSSYSRTTREVTQSKNDVRIIALSSTHVISEFTIQLEQALFFYHTNTNTNTIPTPTCRKERPLGGLSRALLLQSDAC